MWEKISKEIGYVAPASTSSIAPAEAVAAIPPADARPFLTDETPMPALAEEAKHEPTAAMPPAEQLPDAVSDSITASLAKSLAEPPVEATAPPPPRAGQDRADSECRAQRQRRAADPPRQKMAQYGDRDAGHRGAAGDLRCCCAVLSQSCYASRPRGRDADRTSSGAIGGASRRRFTARADMRRHSCSPSIRKAAPWSCAGFRPLPNKAAVMSFG